MAARLTAYVVVGIVAATLIAGLIVGAQRDDNDGPIDIIIHNAKVYTAGPDGRRWRKPSPSAATRFCASAASARSCACAGRRRR